MRALGTIIETDEAAFTEREFYCGFLDYYDDWDAVDPRLVAHHDRLSRAADIFGHDLVNLATYSHEILDRLRPERIREDASLIVVGGMAEAFLVSVRSACDALALALGGYACLKAGQAPADSLRELLQWARKNEARVRPELKPVLFAELAWFWKLRALRDHVVHEGAHAIIHCDGRQFNLWVHSPQRGWITREPLLPLLAQKLEGLVRFGDQASAAINGVIAFPPDRIRSRVLSGVLVPALHQLRRVADQYANPSP